MYLKSYLPNIQRLRNSLANVGIRIFFLSVGGSDTLFIYKLIIDTKLNKRELSDLEFYVHGWADAMEIPFSLNNIDELK